MELIQAKQELKKRIETVLAEMSLKEITSEDDYTLSGEWLKKNKETQKYIEKELEPIKKERYAYYKEVLDVIKELSKPLKEAESILKRQRVKYKQRVEAELRKQREAMMQAAITDEEKEIVQKMTERDNEVEGIYHVEVWDFEIVDVNAIPREYMMPDEKKIRKVVQALKDTTNIPGIKVIKRLEERVRV